MGLAEAHQRKGSAVVPPQTGDRKTVLKSLPSPRPSSKNFPIRFYCNFCQVSNIHLIYRLTRTIPSRDGFTFDCFRVSAHVLIYFYRLTNHLWPFGLALLFTNLCNKLQKNRELLAWHGVDLHSNARSKVRLFQNGECVAKTSVSFSMPVGREGRGQGKFINFSPLHYCTIDTRKNQTYMNQ